MRLRTVISPSAVALCLRLGSSKWTRVPDVDDVAERRSRRTSLAAARTPWEVFYPVDRNAVPARATGYAYTPKEVWGPLLSVFPPGLVYTTKVPERVGQRPGKHRWPLPDRDLQPRVWNDAAVPRLPQRAPRVRGASWSPLRSTSRGISKPA